MHRCFKHTLFAPRSPGLDCSVILIAEIESAFIQSALGIGSNATVAVGLLEISTYLSEIRLILLVFGPLEIVHHHGP